MGARCHQGCRCSNVTGNSINVSSDAGDVHGPGFPCANCPMTSTGVPASTTLRLSSDSSHWPPHSYNHCASRCRSRTHA